MTTHKGIAVYCASSDRLAKAYYDCAREVGRQLALRGVPVINGGGRMGLMAATTEGAIEAGGTSIGVLPSFMLDRGWNHPALTETIELYTGPMVICNVMGFYDKLLEFLAHVDEEHFMRPGAPARLWRVASSAEEAVDMALAPADIITDDYTQGKF